MKKEYDNEMKLEFMCRSCNEAFARLTVAAFASQLDPTIEELSEIKTSVSEIVTNAIIHAYEECDDVIRVHSYIEDNCITIEVQDTGKGIEDIEQARKPLYTTKADLERSGMGFSIVESFMDEVKIESIVGLGTKVTMKKIIRSGHDIFEI